jgi:hypothetical protein
MVIPMAHDWVHPFHILTSLILGVSLLGGACSRPTLPPTASPGTEVVVFVDFSSSIQKGDRGLFQQDLLNLIVPSLAEGDRLLIAPISERTFSDFHPLVEATFPPKPHFNGWMDNTLKYNQNVKETTAEVARVREKLRTDIAQMFSRTPNSLQTDIFSSLVIAEKLFDGEPRKKVLVLMSDMVQDYSPYRFDRIKWSPDVNRQMLDDLASRGFVPNLAGVCLYVSGVSAGTADTAERISDFWQAYFQRTHADASSSRYAHVLLHWPPSKSCRV